MKRALAMLVALAALGLLHCGSDAGFGPPAGDGGSSAGGGGAGGGGDVGGGGAGGGSSCEGLGDACTECAVSSACEGAYCDCLASAECSGIWACTIGCSDAACVDDCEMSYAGGYAEFLLFASCLGHECSGQCGGVGPLGGCAECLLGDCESEVEACVADADCNQYLDCVQACTDGGCSAACYQALPDTTLVDALGACSQASCQGECGGGSCQPLGDACTQCAFDDATCNPLYCGCLADPACAGYAQCVNGCGLGDEACHDVCEATYAAGYSSFYQMVDCMGSSCQGDCGFGALPACFSCLASDCSSELDGCVGDAECNEYLDCVGGCTTPNPTCFVACYGAMTDTTEADALGACLQTTCSGSCT
jgi:hypothetical protein